MIMPHLTPEHVEEKIYPNIAKGFTDTAPVLREMTIKSMIDIAPKLASATINDSLIRNLWNLQVHLFDALISLKEHRPIRKHLFEQIPLLPLENWHHIWMKRRGKKFFLLPSLGMILCG